MLLGISAVVVVACGIDAVGADLGGPTPGPSATSGPPGTHGGDDASDGAQPIDGEDAAAFDANVDDPTLDGGDDGGLLDLDASLDATLDASLDSGTTAPTIEITKDPAAATVDLTAEGTVDWAHWGSGNKLTSVRKGVPSKISTLSIVFNKDTVDDFFGSNFTWTDAPGNTAGSSNQSIVLYNASNSRFSVHVPASSKKQTFVVWVGGTLSRGKLTVALSDNSVAAKTDTSESSTGIYAVRYTIGYASAGAGQLNVDWTIDANLGTDVIRFAAAALR